MKEKKEKSLFDSKRTRGVLVVTVIAVVIVVFLAIAIFAFISGKKKDDGMGKTSNGKIALQALEAVGGKSKITKLADLQQAAEAEDTGQYLEDNSEYELDEDAIKEYVQNFLTSLESTAAASNTTTTALLQEMGYNSIAEYESSITGMVSSFVKQRLAIYTIAKEKKLTLSEAQYESKVGVYMDEYGYQSIETFEAECMPQSIANEMLFDNVLEQLEQGKISN